MCALLKVGNRSSESEMPQHLWREMEIAKSSVSVVQPTRKEKRRADAREDTGHARHRKGFLSLTVQKHI